jgi:tetratricopeptide (TPR) repeat protein
MTLTDSTDPRSVPESELQAIAALGMNYYQQGRLKEAEAVFRFLLVLHPQAYYAHAGAGVVAMSQQPADLQEACQCLSRAAELNPIDASVRASLGEVLLRMGEMEKAAEHLKRSVELDPYKKDSGAARAHAILSGLWTITRQIEKKQKEAAA